MVTKHPSDIIKILRYLIMNRWTFKWQQGRITRKPEWRIPWISNTIPYSIHPTSSETADPNCCHTWAPRCLLQPDSNQWCKEWETRLTLIRITTQQHDSKNWIKYRQRRHLETIKILLASWKRRWPVIIENAKITPPAPQSASGIVALKLQEEVVFRVHRTQRGCKRS